jgi:hypothetical protein
MNITVVIMRDARPRASNLGSALHGESTGVSG